MMCYTLAVVLVCGGRAAVDAARPPGHTLPVHTIPVKGQPSHLLVHQNKLFVSCFHGSNLGIFDTGTRKELQQLFLDAYESPADPKTGTPRSVHHCPPTDAVVANGKLFVGQTFGEHVLVFNLKTMWVVKRLRLGGDGYFTAAADGRSVYFASAEKNEFHIIDTETYQCKTVAYPARGRGIGSLALAPDGHRLYLGIQRGGKHPDGVERSGGNSFLAVYDLTKRPSTPTSTCSRSSGTAPACSPSSRVAATAWSTATAGTVPSNTRNSASSRRRPPAQSWMAKWWCCTMAGRTSTGC